MTTDGGIARTRLALPTCRRPERIPAKLVFDDQLTGKEKAREREQERVCTFVDASHERWNRASIIARGTRGTEGRSEKKDETTAARVGIAGKMKTTDPTSTVAVGAVVWEKNEYVSGLR